MLHVLMLGLLAQAPAAHQPHTPKALDACALVTDADVLTVLGMTVKERQPGSQQAHGLLLSECYLGTGTPRSVSIAVAANTKAGGKTVTPRAFWREHFHGGDPDAEHATARAGAAREPAQGGEERETEARPIAGVGDEAFWSGTRVAGALYVLHGTTFIRVSVGGIGDEAERIEKSRQLAVKALPRLR